MKLFCKCPLPEVGSSDWPWDDGSPVLVKVSCKDSWDRPKEGFIEKKCTPASMPGYVVSCKAFEKDGLQVLGSRVESFGEWREFWEDYTHCGNAREWCEQDARRRWVKQNLLTMTECEMGQEPEREPKVVATIPWPRREPAKRKPKAQKVKPEPTEDPFEGVDRG